jgi:hypothetical protein
LAEWGQKGEREREIAKMKGSRGGKRGRNWEEWEVGLNKGKGENQWFGRGTE